MTLYRVTLRRAETLDRDVEAPDEDTAADRVLLEAPGTPKDWEILAVTPTRDLPATGMRLVG